MHISRRGVTTTAVFGTGVLFVLFLLLFLLWPLTSNPEDALAGITVAPAEHPFAAQYQMGRQLEARGDYSAAAEQYAAAALSGQPEISEAAQDSLLRVLRLAARPSWVWQQRLRQTVASLTALLFGAVIVFVAMVLVWLLVARIGRRTVDALLMPPEDFTIDKAGSGWHLLVADIVRELAGQFQQADSLLLTRFDGHDLPQFLGQPILDSRLALLVEAFDGISVGGFSIKPGNLLRLWLIRAIHYRFLIQPQFVQQGNRLRIKLTITDLQRATTDEAFYVGLDDHSLVQQAGEVAERCAYALLLRCGAADLGTLDPAALQAYTAALMLHVSYASDEAEAAQLETAVGWLEGALASDPDFLPARYLLGVTRQAQLESREAIAMLEPVAASEQPLAVDALYQIGICQAQLYEMYRYDSAARESEEAFAEVVQRIGAKPNGQREELLLALSLCERARLVALRMATVDNVAQAQLQSQLEEHLRQAQGISQEPAVQTAAAYTLGLGFLGNGQSEKARAAFQNAIDLDPRFGPAYVAMARSWPDGSAESEAWLRRAVTASPSFEYAALRLGKQLRRNPGTGADAAARLEEARHYLERTVHSSDGQNELGELLARDGDYTGAMTAFRRAVTLNKRNAVAWQNMAWRTLDAIEDGRLTADPTRLSEAASWAQHAVNLTEGTPKAWRMLDTWGRVLLAQQRYDAAERVLRQSLAAPDGDRWIQNRFHLAQALAGRGSGRAAVAVLDDALKLNVQQLRWRVLAEALREKLSGT